MSLVFAVVAVPAAGSTGQGAVGEVRLGGDASGVLTISWDVPDPVPSDYRVSWATGGLGFLSWRAADEPGVRGNAYPAGERASLTLEGLDPGAAVRVRMRARYQSGGSGGGPWSGPWSEVVSGVVASEAPRQDDVAGSEPDAGAGAELGTQPVQETPRQPAVPLDPSIADLAVRESSEETESESETESSEESESESAAVGEPVGTLLVGAVTFGEGVSGGSGFVGYSRPRRPGMAPRAGGLEVSYVRGELDLFAVAQLPGAVSGGPADGLSDPVVLTLMSGAVPAGEFWFQVGDHLLSSADAVLRDVGALSGGPRYWVWDAPCKTWDVGDTVELRLTDSDSDAGAAIGAAYVDATLGTLSMTGASLGRVFDSAISGYTAAAPASAERVTVDAEAGASQACGVRISPADADAGADGHQVDLGEHGTVITVTATAADGATVGAYTVVTGRGAQPAVAKSLSLDGIGDVGFSPFERRYEADVPAGAGSTRLRTASLGDAVLDAFSVTAGRTQVTQIGPDGRLALAAGRDTLVAVRATTPGNERQSVYTVRLRASQQAPQQTPRSASGNSWGSASGASQPGLTTKGPAVGLLGHSLDLVTRSDTDTDTDTAAAEPRLSGLESSGGSA